MSNSPTLEALAATAEALAATAEALAATAALLEDMRASLDQLDPDSLLDFVESAHEAQYQLGRAVQARLIEALRSSDETAAAPKSMADLLAMPEADHIDYDFELKRRK